MCISWTIKCLIQLYYSNYTINSDIISGPLIWVQKTKIVENVITNCVLCYSLSFQTWRDNWCQISGNIDNLILATLLSIFMRCIFPGKRAHLSKYVKYIKSYFFIWLNSPQWARASSFTRLLDHTQRSTTVGRTPLDEWSARCRDLYLTINNTHNRRTSMPRWDSNPQSQQASGRRPTP